MGLVRARSGHSDCSNRACSVQTKIRLPVARHCRTTVAPKAKNSVQCHRHQTDRYLKRSQASSSRRESWAMRGNHAAGSDMPILASAMSPGDMLIWKSYTLHSAPGNRLDRRRAAFSVNWVGDDIVYNAKPSLEAYRDPTLTIGKPIFCKKFPLVRG